MHQKNYQIQTETDTLASLISTSIPTCKSADTLDDITRLLIENSWDDMDYVFVLNANKELVGVIDMADLSQNDRSIRAENLLKPINITLKPDDKRQRAVVLAVKHDADILPVVDAQQKFMGAIISKTIIDLMHAEHLENALLSSGLAMKRHKILEITSVGIFEVVGYRLPWLVFGLVAGLGLGLISSRFEEHLQNNIAIAYFIPVVAYIADSVGTQSEAIAVRSLATLKVSPIIYLIRELFAGVIMGIVIGILGGIGAFAISTQPQIGLVVGLSLFAASAIASLLASSIPIAFKAMDKDPALGSGPLATALQDIISVLVYFVFVSVLL